MPRDRAEERLHRNEVAVVVVDESRVSFPCPAWSLAGGLKRSGSHLEAELFPYLFLIVPTSVLLRIVVEGAHPFGRLHPGVPW